jgi:hypothetical protein
VFGDSVLPVSVCAVGEGGGSRGGGMRGSASPQAAAQKLVIDPAHTQTYNRGHSQQSALTQMDLQTHLCPIHAEGNSRI